MTPWVNVSYIDEPLTVKRAGHGDQLSEKYGRIEYFRIEALMNLIECEAFADVPKASVRERTAREELARKCRIFANGARKRGRIEEADRYVLLAERYDPA